MQKSVGKSPKEGVARAKKKVVKRAKRGGKASQKSTSRR
jgi:hypothetical protein